MLVDLPSISMVVHLLDPTVGIQSLQLCQTVEPIHPIKIHFYRLNCPCGLRAYEILGIVAKENKERHRDAQSAPTLLVQTAVHLYLNSVHM